MLAVATVTRWIALLLGDGDFWLWPALYSVGVAALATSPVISRNLRRLRHPATGRRAVSHPAAGRRAV